MKQLQLASIAICFFAISCGNSASKNDSELTGKWKLIETFMDPGDGSGVFEPTDLNITMTFSTDNSITANGVLCGLQESTSIIVGQFSILDSIITVPCDGGELRHSVTLHKQELIISNLSCPEPCRAKLIRE